MLPVSKLHFKLTIENNITCLELEVYVYVMKRAIVIDHFIISLLKKLSAGKNKPLHPVKQARGIWFCATATKHTVLT